MVKSNLQKLGREAIEISDDVLLKEAEMIKRDSQDEVPFRLGTLWGAFFINLIKGGRNKTSEVLLGYSSSVAPYAWIQHENLAYRHSAGRKAKFLEDPMTRRGDRMAKSLAAAFKKRLGT